MAKTAHLAMPAMPSGWKSALMSPMTSLIFAQLLGVIVASAGQQSIELFLQNR
jgi:hypothetical protein